MLLKNGDFFIIESRQLNILDMNFCPLQPPILGIYYGLEECHDGSVYTLEESVALGRNPVCLRKLLKLDNKYFME